ncbi:MAG: adenylate/guanylate cyclase domain-containing protein, partial [Anaerolineae bacterium]|nr:adenylate/guanylate cyclase domain-containing protein [Anaerolineae bacterium]
EEINRAYRMELQYSLGIHVGEAVVGYLGTQYAVNYTAIGDTVNLAKRLQEKAAPGQILVSDLLVQKLGRQAQVKPVGKIKLKGREETAMVYELLELSS